MSKLDETKEMIEIALSRLDYNQDNGIFTWTNPVAKAVKVGATAGSLRSDGYVTISINNIAVLAHRLAWAFHYGVWPSDEVDHINCDRSDNRIVNLRSSGRSQNCMNRNQRSDNTSGYKGVSFDKKSRSWVARCQADGVRHVVGFYENKEDAAADLIKFRAKLHKDFKNNGDKNAK